MFASNIIRVVFILAIVESVVWAQSTKRDAKYSINAYCVPKDSIDYLSPMTTAPMPYLSSLPAIDIDKLSTFLNHLGNFGILYQQNGQPVYIDPPKNGLTKKTRSQQIQTECVEGETMFMFAIKPNY